MAESPAKSAGAAPKPSPKSCPPAPLAAEPGFGSGQSQGRTGRLGWGCRLRLACGPIRLRVQHYLPLARTRTSTGTDCALLHFRPASVSRPSTSLLDSRPPPPKTGPFASGTRDCSRLSSAPDKAARSAFPPVSWFARLFPRPRPATHHSLSPWRGRESCRPALLPAQSNSPSAAILRLAVVQRHRLLRRRLLSLLLRNRRQHRRARRCQSLSSLASRCQPSRSPSPRACPQRNTNRSRKGSYMQ